MSTVTKLGTATLTAPVLAGGITNASITTTTDRPYSLATMDVDGTLKLDAINRKLQVESTLDEIFTDIGADVVFTGKKVSIPDACIMRVSAMAEGNAHTTTLPMINPLTGPGRGGVAEDQQGYERSRTLEHLKIYYNEFSQAVMGETWGVNYNDLQLLNFYAEEQPGLSKWFAEDEGKQYRQSLWQTYAWPLAKAGVVDDSTGLTQRYNNNIFVANTALGSQPSYSATAATHLSNIATALDAADTGTAGVNANIDLDNLLAIDYYVQNVLRLKPVMIGGKKSYVMLLPSTQYHKLMQVNNGQLGSVWENVSSLSEEEQNFPGIIGRVKSLVIVEDQRYPTVEFDDYSTPVATNEYCEPGNDDDRNKAVYDGTTNLAWDIGFVMGQAAIVDWNVRDLHFEKETTEYTKRYGYGGFRERGIQLAQYDIDTAGGATKNFGSMACLWTATSIVTTA